jgi:hypothetical protein
VKALKRGVTILELAISMTLISIIGTSVLLVSSSGSQAMKQTALSALVQSNARAGVSALAARLVGAELTSMLPVDVIAPGSTTSIEYQRIIGFLDGAVAWSNTERIELEPSPTDANDGIDNNGNGLVDECRVVWTQNVGLANESRVVLVAWARETLAGEISGNNIDDNGNGLVDEAGLCFDYDGRQLNIHLSLEIPSNGLDYAATRTVEKTMILNAYDV